MRIQHLQYHKWVKLNSSSKDQMVECVYRNITNKMVILKCIGAKHFYHEKVVMPTELYSFKAPEDGRLEIWRMSGQGQMLHIRADVAEYAIQHESAANTALAC